VGGGSEAGSARGVDCARAMVLTAGTVARCREFHSSCS
jgi:hypothetical protein